jgi:histidinol-phosphate aminotransferase
MSLLRLHLNENTGGCSPAVVAAVRAFDGERLARYPDYERAAADTAAYLDVETDRLQLTNGLDEGLLLTSMAYLTSRTPAALVDAGAPLTAPSGQPEVIVAMPAFDPYVVTARGMGARVVAIKATRDYTYPTDAVLRAVSPATRLIYVNNPNNPTGQPVPKDAIHRVAREAGHAIVFVDEAYHDFLGEHFLEEARDYPNVIIGRTFSKAHGLAGIRVGALVAAPAVLAPIRAVTPLFNLNVVAVDALRAALTDQSFTPWYVAQAAESRRLMYDALDRLNLRYWASAANFVLVDGGGRAESLVAGLRERQILVRDRTKDPSCPDCFRITTGIVDHTRAAIAALEALCERP